MFTLGELEMSTKKASTRSSSSAKSSHSGKKHQLGEGCLYYSDRGATPQAGQVVFLHEDGVTACVTSWCSKSSQYLPRFNVPHVSDAYASGPYWTCLGEETPEEDEDCSQCAAPEGMG